jgi:hypothetical protein
MMDMGVSNNYDNSETFFQEANRILANGQSSKTRGVPSTDRNHHRARLLEVFAQIESQNGHEP